MNATIIFVIIIILAAAVLIKFLIEKIIESMQEVNTEEIMIDVCPSCGGMNVTTTAENTSLGFNLKCKDCKYIGTMLEMNLPQAKTYHEMKNKDKN